jgi:hypothetical protein
MHAHSDSGRITRLNCLAPILRIDNQSTRVVVHFIAVIGIAIISVGALALTARESRTDPANRWVDRGGCLYLLGIALGCVALAMGGIMTPQDRLNGASTWLSWVPMAAQLLFTVPYSIAIAMCLIGLFIRVRAANS